MDSGGCSCCKAAQGSLSKSLCRDLWPPRLEAVLLASHYGLLGETPGADTAIVPGSESSLSLRYTTSTGATVCLSHWLPETTRLPASMSSSIKTEGRFSFFLYYAKKTT